MILVEESTSILDFFTVDVLIFLIHFNQSQILYMNYQQYRFIDYHFFVTLLLLLMFFFIAQHRLLTLVYCQVLQDFDQCIC